MATVRRGPGVPAPAPNVQAFVDAVVEDVGLAEDNAGTYFGHDPSPDLAVDIFVDLAQGDAVCRFAFDHWHEYGLTYIIFYQRINSNDGRGWRAMADRGSATANHYDHVHVSFEDMDDFYQEDDLTPDEHKTLYETKDLATSTNAAVGRMETAVRDSTSGLQVQMDRLIAAVEALRK